MKNDQRGYFEHYQENGGFKKFGKITTRPVVDRLLASGVQRPSNTIPIGAVVRRANTLSTIGQVWAQAPRPHHVWVVSDDGQASLWNERYLQVVGLPGEQLELPA